MRDLKSISVAMATYNGARYLREQLDSIAGQTHVPMELQIGDDGSTDDTQQIVEEFARSAPFPVHFHRNQSNFGYARNFLETASRCSGDWIAFSDQDDVWIPHKLERCEHFLSAAGDEDIVMIAHSAQVVGSDLEPTGEIMPKKAKFRIAGPLSHHANWSHYGFAQIFRRDLLSKFDSSVRVPTFFTNIDPYPHDVWVSALANVVGKTLHMPDRLVLYRRHGGSVTNAAKTPPPSFASSLLATGAVHYQHRAAVCEEAYHCLEHQRRQGFGAGWADRLAKGADLYRRLARAYLDRAEIYRSGSLGHRLSAVTNLAATGGYFNLGASSFGAGALIKDVAAAFALSFSSRGRGESPQVP